MNDRGTGKTTRLIEEAISLLADLPEDTNIFITGAHINWIHELNRRFKSSGLPNVIFFTPSQIKEGALRGRKGILLIDDYIDLSLEDKIILSGEQKRLYKFLRSD